MTRKDHMNSITRCLFAGLLAGCAALAFAAEPSTTEKISSYAHERKAEAVAEAKRLIAEADKKIDELKAQARQSGAETKAAHEANMKELQQKKKEANAQLAKLQKASSKTWEATKEGFANAYQAMRASYEKATSESK
jgi:succinate dehydrogenase/fumarate reductase flavoprotein subunit